MEKILLMRNYWPTHFVIKIIKRKFFFYNKSSKGVITSFFDLTKSYYEREDMKFVIFIFECQRL